jgi:hypothetical protein
MPSKKTFAGIEVPEHENVRKNWGSKSLVVPLPRSIHHDLRNLPMIHCPATFVDDVFEGGGVLGTDHVGALHALDDNAIRFSASPVIRRGSSSHNGCRRISLPKVQRLSGGTAKGALPATKRFDALPVPFRPRCARVRICCLAKTASIEAHGTRQAAMLREPAERFRVSNGTGRSPGREPRLAGPSAAYWNP